MAHLTLALGMWLCAFGMPVLAWKRRLPPEMVLVFCAILGFVAWGGVTLVQK